MIIDCEVSVLNPGTRAKYSRAKVGIGMHNENAYLCIVTSKNKERFMIRNNCTVRSSTLSFNAPKKDVYIRNADQLMMKSLMSIIGKILRSELIPKLSKIEDIEKQKPLQTSLTISGSNLRVNELKNQQLTKLCASDVKLIPRLVWDLRNLTELRLVNCIMNDIEPRMLRLGKSLRILEISHCDLPFIDGSFFESMKQLIYLDLSHNKFKFIPLEIVQLQNMTTLNLSHNSLDHLPYTIGKILSLKQLIVLHNNFVYFPNSLIRLMMNRIRLDSLDISENDLSHPCIRYDDKCMSPPKLSELSKSAILSNDKVLFNCSKILPKKVYIDIQMNAEMCGFCRSPIGYKSYRFGVFHQSFDSITNTLSSSSFPSFPLVPVFVYRCFKCNQRVQLHRDAQNTNNANFF